MIGFPNAPVQPRAAVLSALEAGVDRLSRPGTWWTGAERRDIAAAARSARLGTPGSGTVLDETVGGVVEVIATRPASVSRGWVESAATALGVRRYVEVLGVVSQMVAIDTFARLLGSPPTELVPVVPGEPSRNAVDVAHSRTWVPAGAFPSPPHVLALVPDEVVAQNALSDVLYMPDREMVDPGWSRNGMHRAQAELAAATVSHGNECFY